MIRAVLPVEQQEVAEKWNWGCIHTEEACTDNLDLDCPGKSVDTQIQDIGANFASVVVGLAEVGVAAENMESLAFAVVVLYMN